MDEEKDPITEKARQEVDSSIFFLLRAWIGRQSLPRFLGLMLGNTRELENVIARQDAAMCKAIESKDEEIRYLRERLDALELKFISFQDSVLISKGMVATTHPNSPPPPVSRQVNVSTSSQYDIIVEVDKLKELFVHNPNEAYEKFDDYLAVNNPRSKEIAAQFSQWVGSIQDGGDGVLIQM